MTGDETCECGHGYWDHDTAGVCRGGPVADPCACVEYREVTE